MLYNQALLSRNYLSAYLINGDPEHRRIVQRVLDYVLREMTSPEGGFYSATDADSAGAEGTFFVAIELWNVTKNGNFEHSNILHYNDTFGELASARNTSAAELMTARREDHICMERHDDQCLCRSRRHVKQT